MDEADRNLLMIKTDEANRELANGTVTNKKEWKPKPPL